MFSLFQFTEEEKNWDSKRLRDSPKLLQLVSWVANPGGCDSKAHAFNYHSAQCSPVFTQPIFLSWSPGWCKGQELSEFLLVPPPFSFRSSLVRAVSWIRGVIRTRKGLLLIRQCLDQDHVDHTVHASFFMLCIYYYFNTNVTWAHQYNEVYEWDIKCLLFL